MSSSEWFPSRVDPHLLAQIVEGLPSGITVQERDGRICYANAAAAELIGFEGPAALQSAAPGEILARFELFHPDGAPMDPSDLPGRMALAGEDAPERLFRFRVKATGQERWCLCSARAVLDEDGKPRRAINVFRDATLQQRSVQALRFLSEATALLSASLDYEVTLTAVARIAVPRLADWCAVEVLEPGGKSSRQVAVSHVDPQKVRLAHELRAKYPPSPDDAHGVQQVLRTGQSQLLEEITDAMIVQGTRSPEHLEIIRALGLKSAMVVPMRARGRVLGAITLVSAESNRRFDAGDLDLAESLAHRAAAAVDNARLYQDARVSEERLKLALDSGKMGAWEWHIASSRVTWSPGLERIHGIPEGSFGGTFEAFQKDIDPQDAPQVLSTVQGAVEQHRPDMQLMYRIVRADGQVRWVESRGQLIFDELGRPERMTGVCTDITERREAEENARRLLVEQAAHAETAAAQQELSRSNAELQQFAYVASHDLQEPLRAVASYTQLLAKKYRGRLDADADQFIQFAVEGAVRMQGLIRDLLFYSRVGMGAKEPSAIPCERLLATAMANLKVAIEQSGAEIFHGPLPVLKGDEGQLVQLFQNLLANAIKFRRGQNPRIQVTAHPEGSDWEIQVKDDGIGISPEYFDRVFIIFQRLHAQADYPGNGIGLAVCKKIVERHGGKIWIDSQPNQGATFHFTLPSGESER